MLTLIILVFAGFFILRKIPDSEKVSFRARKRLNETLVNQIEKISDTIGVPPNIIGGIVIVESGGDILAQGKANERGLMQLTEVALNDVNNNEGTNFTFNQMFTPIQNLAAGALFYRLQLKRMGNHSDAIRAYNCGEAGAIGGCGFIYLALVKIWL